MASTGDIIRVVTKSALQQQNVFNVFHFACLANVADFQMTDDLRDRVEYVMTPIRAVSSSAVLYTTIEIINETDEENLGEFSWPTFVAGLRTGSDPLPNGVAALITMPTAFGKTRGRKFFAGITEEYASGGLFVGDVITAMTSAAGRLLLPFAGTVSGEPYANGVVRSVGGFTQFTSAVISNIPAYQRRRKQGVGI